MEIKEFKGYEDVYPEKIIGTDQWFYGQCTPCSEAYEVPEFNGRIVVDPYILVKNDIHNDVIDLLWPIERRYQFEENESLVFVHDDKLFTSKWIEDPDYREEVIVREKITGEVIDRKPGYLVIMSNGVRWLMTR